MGVNIGIDISDLKIVCPRGSLSKSISKNKRCVRVGAIDQLVQNFPYEVNFLPRPTLALTWLRQCQDAILFEYSVQIANFEHYVQQEMCNSRREEEEKEK